MQIEQNPSATLQYLSLDNFPWPFGAQDIGLLSGAGGFWSMVTLLLSSKSEEEEEEDNLNDE